MRSQLDLYCRFLCAALAILIVGALLMMLAGCVASGKADIQGLAETDAFTFQTTPRRS